MAMTADEFDALARIMSLRETSSARAALRLVLVDGKNHTDAADAVGIARQVVTKRVSRAREVVADAGSASLIAFAGRKGLLKIIPLFAAESP
jgi:DNA-directed RNA polymerase specialized sigma24 family protein